MLIKQLRGSIPGNVSVTLPVAANGVDASAPVAARIVEMVLAFVKVHTYILCRVRELKSLDNRSQIIIQLL